jgi:hypothetical protein
MVSSRNERETDFGFPDLNNVHSAKQASLPSGSSSRESCHDYWNRMCEPYSRCGSPEFTPCDFTSHTLMQPHLSIIKAGGEQT